MKRTSRWTLFFVSLAMFALLMGCAGSDHVEKTDGADLAEGDAPDCANPETQQLLTYCAGPSAAKVARRNAEISDAIDGGESVAAFVPVPVLDSPSMGPTDAAVTVVMFTDLQCPFCSRAHETLEMLREERPESIRVVFKHMPLPFHKEAVPAALGALAAAEQGKFWEFAELAYHSQDALKESDLVGYAEQLGLDVEQWRADYGSERHIEMIERDMSLARTAGVEGTPTLFFNGVRVVGAQSEETMRAVVDQQMSLVAALEEAGVPQDDLYWRMVNLQYEEPDYDRTEVAAEEEEETPKVVHVPVGEAPVKGAAAADALVTIVEFSDFQCPFCQRANDSLDKVVEARKGTVRVAFRHFPLPFHEQADEAARASIAARRAGKFWEYHDALFANQTALMPDDLKSYAEEVGLESTTIEEALESEKTEKALQADIDLGREAGVRGTPTYFVNGVMVIGVQSPEEFEVLIDEQLAVARAVKAETGLEGEALYEEVVKRNQQQ